MKKKRTNSPEVIARANANRIKNNAKRGKVKAQPTLVVESKYRDRVRDAGLKRMQEVYAELKKKSK